MTRSTAQHPWLLAMCVGLALVASKARAACPTICPCSVPQCSTDSIGTFFCTPSHGNRGGGYTSWDMTTGLIGASGSDFGSGGLTARDSIEVLETPGGTAATITVVMSFQSYGYNGGGGGSLSITGKGGASESCELGPLEPPLFLPRSCGSVRTINFDVVPGERLELVANAYGGGLGSGSGSIQYRFEMPNGVRMRSCHGYRFAVPVSTRSASWGQLKVLYR